MDRPLVFDVDGVVANFVENVCRSLHYELSPHQFTDYNFKNLLTRRQLAILHPLLENPYWWLLSPRIVEGLNLLRTLRDYYRDKPFIWATTPWVGCDGWESARRKWLDTHAGAQGDPIFFGKHKEYLNPAVFVDDHPDNCLRVLECCPDCRVILIDTPYNRYLDDPRVERYSLL